MMHSAIHDLSVLEKNCGGDKAQDEAAKDDFELAEDTSDLEKLLKQTEEMNAVISAVTSCARTGGGSLSVSGSGWGRAVRCAVWCCPGRALDVCAVAWLWAALRCVAW